MVGERLVLPQVASDQPGKTYELDARHDFRTSCSVITGPRRTVQVDPKPILRLHVGDSKRITRERFAEHLEITGSDQGRIALGQLAMTERLFAHLKPGFGTDGFLGLEIGLDTDKVTLWGDSRRRILLGYEGRVDITPVPQKVSDSNVAAASIEAVMAVRGLHPHRTSRTPKILNYLLKDKTSSNPLLSLTEAEETA